MSPRAWPHGAGCRVCVSVAAPSLEALVRRVASERRADLVEVRLDALDDPLVSADELNRVVEASPAGVGFALRPVWQGGAFAGPEDARRAVLEARIGGESRAITSWRSSPPASTRCCRCRTW